MRLPEARSVLSTPNRWSSGEWLPHSPSVTSAGTKIVHLQQYFRGLRVYRSAIVVKSRPRKAARPSAGEATVPLSTATVPRLTAWHALAAALKFLQRRRAVSRAVRPRLLWESRFDLREMPTILTCRAGFTEPIRAHLEVFPTSRKHARLSWVFDIAPRGKPRCEVVVSADARRPAVLFSHRATSCLDFQASWIRFPREAGVSRSFPIPPPACPIGSRRPRPTAWLDAPGRASGPNVSCHVGTKAVTAPLAGSDVENTFVWCNLLHDFFAAFGFDSSLGAFDSGEDALQVRLFKSKSSRAGFFDNKVDGSSPQMMLFSTRSSSGVHAALDPTVVAHEYAHGVSNRLLGGTELTSPFAGTEGQGLNEGYSDYFALTIVSFLDRSEGHDRDLRQIGTGFRPPSGVRDYRSFDRPFSSGLKDEYELAMVWCAALLHARAALIGGVQLTPDDADCYLWQALLDSLRGMAPTCPRHGCLTLAHAKDALLTASLEIEKIQPAAAGSANAIGGALSDRRIV